MKLEGAIFDFDGTLADTLPVCFAASRRVGREFLGRDHMTEEEIRATFGPSEIGMIQRMVPDRWEAALEAFLDEYEAAHDACTAPFPGMEDALRLLRRRGVALAIVTGKGPPTMAISMRLLGLEDYFDVIETGSPEGNVKATLLRKVLARWGCEPRRVAYVGDAAVDVVEAREAGVIPLAAAWAATAKPEQLRAEAPHALFPTVDSFIDWIDKNVNNSAGSESRR